jgi:hypothetical protein
MATDDRCAAVSAPERIGARALREIVEALEHCIPRGLSKEFLHPGALLRLSLVLFITNHHFLFFIVFQR